jgi:hypothetical protein
VIQSSASQHLVAKSILRYVKDCQQHDHPVGARRGTLMVRLPVDRLQQRIDLVAGSVR